jgi:hypothetical protein
MTEAVSTSETLDFRQGQGLYFTPSVITILTASWWFGTESTISLQFKSPNALKYDYTVRRFVFSDMPVLLFSLFVESENPITVYFFYFNTIKVQSLLEFPVSLNMRT